MCSLSEGDLRVLWSAMRLFLPKTPHVLLSHALSRVTCGFSLNFDGLTGDHTEPPNPESKCSQQWGSTWHSAEI